LKKDKIVPIQGLTPHSHFVLPLGSDRANMLKKMINALGSDRANMLKIKIKI
jgi:hypothetical protein